MASSASALALEHSARKALKRQQHIAVELSDMHRVCTNDTILFLSLQCMPFEWCRKARDGFKRLVNTFGLAAAFLALLIGGYLQLQSLADKPARDMVKARWVLRQTLASCVSDLYASG